MDPLQVPLLQKNHEIVENVSMWDWSGSALAEGADAADWFSRYLGKPYRLVRFDTGKFCIFRVDQIKKLIVEMLYN